MPAPSCPAAPARVAPDRYTALSAAAGAILGARGYPFWTAALFSVGLEAFVQFACRQWPAAFPGSASPLGKSAVDVTASLGGWVVGSTALPPPPRAP